ncbi:hypothetical protein [Pseudovibrio sp. WM33]|uniref:hypothetical protein n=1 Tax=Pseudovibrio sp. WM33 TaxID=1735585 RepID=UPI0007AE78EE|nr:hypothetical protein [Pseudovibrio sp. WM33]KZL24534.1 hypothetical protein PsWM33_02523 [Pseudovibrio sp. WM33]
MLEITGNDLWRGEFKPLGERGLGSQVEKLGDYLDRVKLLVPNLPDELIEQWPYRHWDLTQFRCVPLDRLECREVLWEPRFFLDNVGTYFCPDSLNPTHAYETLHRDIEGKPTHTSKPFEETGEWDYAPIVLETPDGYRTPDDVELKFPYLLIEGHQRRAYLNALLHRGEAVCAQRVLLVRLREE